MVERKILLNPGPATTTDTVKNAQVVPDICPREEEFGDLIGSIRKDLVKIATKQTDEYDCVILGGSGTAAMESVLASVVKRNSKLLIINNGAYGKRFSEIAQTYDINYIEDKYEWDQLPDLKRIEKILSENKDIEYVTAIHHETTSGILNPIKQIGEICKKQGCVFIVDAISTFAGIVFDFDDYNIDFGLSASNKCIQGMPGISFVICRKSELQKLKDIKSRVFYLDLYKQFKSLEEKKQTRFTPPVQTMYALKKAIEEFFEETAEVRAQRYTENWRTLMEGLRQIGFKMLLKDELHSKILITVFEPSNPEYDFKKLHDLLFGKNFTIYPGKIGSLDTFRVATMGAINSEDMKEFLLALKNSLKDMGIDKLSY